MLTGHGYRQGQGSDMTGLVRSTRLEASATPPRRSHPQSARSLRSSRPINSPDLERRRVLEVLTSDRSSISRRGAPEIYAQLLDEGISPVFGVHDVRVLAENTLSVAERRRLARQPGEGVP